jgi:hypothetical protein
MYNAGMTHETRRGDPAMPGNTKTRVTGGDNLDENAMALAINAACKLGIAS